ncbi:MAG: GNAT family N-acetyltransferase [Verrucomicrobiota bacterium]
MSIRIRAAAQNDANAWTQMRAELWPDCPAARHELEVKQLLQSPGLVIVAEADGELVGFAEISVRVDHVEGTAAAPVPYLEGWYVKTAWRGRSIGRELIRFAENWAYGNGYRELASDAELEHADSIGAHVALGFREVGRNVHFVKALRGTN